MKTLKKSLPIILSLVMAFGVVALFGGGKISEAGLEVSATSYNVGDSVEFGTYPQKKVIDPPTLEYLETKTSELNWVSYGYYAGNGDWSDGGMYSQDYMKYADITVKGIKYRAVWFTEYRPHHTGYTTDEANSYQYSNNYFIDRIYWFKFEPIVWRVLSPSSGLLLCENILDSQAFNNYCLKVENLDLGINEYFGNSGQSYFANSYSNSSIKTWLNNDFYNLAFSPEDKNNIISSDGAFLLSADDVKNTSYGFSGDATEHDEARRAKGTDYAKCQGLSGDGWLLSSPGNFTHYVRFVQSSGCAGEDYAIGVTCATTNGVRVATKVSNLNDLPPAQTGTETYMLSYDSNGGAGRPSAQVGDTSYTVTSFEPTRSDYNFLGWSKNKTATTASYIFGDIITLTENTTLYAVWAPEGATEEDIYNLGEETYSFENFSDSVSQGYCFGMSMTSAAYHNGILDITQIGGNEENDLYTLSFSDTVKTPIRRYQFIQGAASNLATVAGGSYYLNRNYDISSDWNSVVNYVRSGSYDGKGTLQIGFRKQNQGGHAVNFLRYEEVGGQQRIYAYDNNFPTVETYFYKNTDGKVYQANDSTFSGSIDCIVLRSVTTYFSVAGTYDLTRAIYAREDSIAVPNATKYYIEASDNNDMVVFEVPQGADETTIIPLKDNASFTYLEEEFGFDEITEETVGTLALAENENEVPEENDLVVEEKPLTKANIKNYVASRTVDYKTTITFTADIENAVEGEEIIWYVNGNEVGRGETYTAEKVKGDFTVQCKTKDIKGNVTESEIETVKVKSGFFDKIIAFFRGLFRRLPNIVQ